MDDLNRFDDALALSAVAPFPMSHAPDFLRAFDWQSAPTIPPTSEPYDENGRFDLVRFPNFMSTRVCLRFDLRHPCVGEALARRLAERHPSTLGGDGAMYVYESSMRSQYQNARLAKVRILAAAEAAGESSDG